MSNLPQTTQTEQAEAASMAHPSRRKKDAQGGDFVVSKTRSKARAEVPPETTSDLQGQYSQEYLNVLKRAETAERQLESTRKWRDQLRAAEMRAKAEAVEWQGKARAAQAQAELNARIAEEEHAQAVTLLAENTNLRAALAEQEDTPPARCPACEIKDQRIAHLEGLNEFNDRYIADLQAEQRWQKQAAASDELEAATKLVAMAMRNACRGKEEGYTAVYTEDIAKACGLNRQAAGRHMNAAVEWGMFGGYRTEEKATVADARLGKREIKKKILHVSPTALLERPEDWKRGDGKQHGGSTRRCKRCGAEDTLRVVPHTVCLHCGAEDIFIPEDAQAALDRARSLQPEDAQAAVTEAEKIFAQVAQVAPAQEEAAQVVEISEVQDEHQSRARLEEARALLAKMHAHDCGLRIRPEDGAFGIQVPESWSDEKYQALASKVLALDVEMRAALAEHEEAARLAQVTEVQDEHDCQPAQEAAPAAPAAKLGTCLVPGYKTGKPCGSTRWLPSAEEEYVCFTCLSPIEWTRKIERERA